MEDYRAEEVCLVSVDPGSYHLGAATYIHNARYDLSRLVATGDMDVADHERYPRYDVHGVRGKRLQLMAEFLYQYLCIWKPDYVVCEDAYLSRFATPYRSLVEGIAAIRQALHRYDPTMELILVEPSAAKVAFGASGGKGDVKERARAGVYKHVGPISDIDLTVLNEHVIDAVGIGFWGIEKWRMSQQWPVPTEKKTQWWEQEPVRSRQPPPEPKSSTAKRTSRKRRRGKK